MKKFMKNIKVFCCGLFMGVAGIIPGVSSGTVAVVAGVYQELIESFRSLVSRNQPKLNPILFLLTLFSGMAIATFLFANVMNLLLSRYPDQMKIFFVGLIIGTIPLLYRKVQSHELNERFKPNHLVIYIIAFVASFYIVLYFGQSQTETEPIRILNPSTILLVFLAGFVSSGTGLVPGISGSMVLLSIGMYSTLMTALEEFNWPILLILAFGALIGFILQSWDFSLVQRS